MKELVSAASNLVQKCIQVMSENPNEQQIQKISRTFLFTALTMTTICGTASSIVQEIAAYCSLSCIVSFCLILQYPVTRSLSFPSEQLASVFALSSNSDLFVILGSILLSSYGQSVSSKLNERVIGDICQSLKQFLFVWSHLSSAVISFLPSYS